MTANRNLKRRVRARAAKTGESYAAALRHVRPTRQGDSMPEVTAMRLATAQIIVREDPSDRAQLRDSGRDVRELMRQAHAAGARIIHFPEGATCSPHKRIMSSVGPAEAGPAEAGPAEVGPADWSRANWLVLRQEVEAIARLAGELRLWTVLGSVHRLTPPHRPHNSMYVISDRGELVTRYDERLLSNTKLSFMYTPGSGPVTFEVDGLRFGCAMGIEVHFPEVFAEYERLDVDGVLLSTGPGQTLGGTAAWPLHTMGSEVQPPVAVRRDGPLRVLEGDLPVQREAGLAADRVRCRIPGGGEGVQPLMPVLDADPVNHRQGGGGRDPAPVEGRDHTPPCLVHLLPVPGPLPVADIGHPLAIGQQYGEHPAGRRVGQPEIAPVPVKQLLLALRAAQVSGHLRRVRLPEEIEIGCRPRLQPDGYQALSHARHASASHRHRGPPGPPDRTAAGRYQHWPTSALARISTSRHHPWPASPLAGTPAARHGNGARSGSTQPALA